MLSQQQAPYAVRGESYLRQAVRCGTCPLGKCQQTLNLLKSLVSGNNEFAHPGAISTTGFDRVHPRAGGEELLL